MNLVFRYPYFLYAALSIPFIVLILRRIKKKSTLIHPHTSVMLKNKFPGIIKRDILTPMLRCLSLICLMIALAQPLGPETEMEYETKGVDIIIALDISGSMRAEDFQPNNRLEVAKDEAKRFISSRNSDRIGLVIFAAQSFTQCPLTLDYDILKELIDQVRMGVVKDGTAIGLAIANGVSRLKESTAKSKIIILLTDGENNSGQIDPFTAAEIAKTMGIRIYTIGVGKDGLVPYPAQHPIYGKIYKNIRLDVDEKTLKQIASITDGLYFRAYDKKGLHEIYKTINELEKTDIKVKEYVNYKQLYQYPLMFGLLFLFIEILFSYGIALKLP